MSSNHPLRIVVVGHVDHGKSTLVGRLLHETGSLPDGRVDSIRAASEKRGVVFEWAFLLDALQAERDQGITIDTTQIVLSTPGRDTVIVDAPGHKEFLKNMITGAASADGAVLVIDALEGVREQTRRHAYVLRLLGLSQVVVAVNKMDAVEWREERFREVEKEILEYLEGIGVKPSAVVPIAARDGANLLNKPEGVSWDVGPALIEALGAFSSAPSAVGLPLRLPLQDVLKLDSRRILVGKIESGRLKTGDLLRFSPSGKTARIASIESWGKVTPALGVAGQSVGITLDEQIFVERGEVATHAAAPPIESYEIEARIFWLGEKPLAVGDSYILRLNSANWKVEVSALSEVVDAADLSGVSGLTVEKNGVALVRLRSRTPMSVDRYAENPKTGRFVLVEGHRIAGGGIVEKAKLTADEPVSKNIYAVGHGVSEEARRRGNGHRGGVIWLTGLSGSGKSTIAMEVEQYLFRRGFEVYVLDGDNLRHGLNKDLGFSPKDRAENIRRAGEVAHLFAQAGMIVITSFISPYRADRDKVRAMGPERFHEVYVEADVDTCIKRDPKGLYARAIKGEIPEFTGISAPYEAPNDPELLINTAKRDLGSCVETLLEHIGEHFLDGGLSLRRAAG